jgi:tetratricopeptide (TPR) repeat protein
MQKFISALFCGCIVVVILCTSSSAATQTKQQIEAAYKKSPSDNMLKYQWATVAPCSTAVILYKELSASPTVHDTLKAAACAAIGEYYFSQKKYDSAIEQYKSSIKYVSSSKIRDRWALCLFCVGQYDAALTLWNALALEFKKEYGVTADFYSGCVALRNGKYTDALNCFEKCGKPDLSKPFTVEALSGKHFCMVKLGKLNDAALLAEQLKPFSLLSIVWPEFKGQTQVVAVKEEKTEEKSPSNGEMQDGFTVQVGAFSTFENASVLQNRLSQQFKNVSVATVTLDDKTFYRVRIGSFATREDADRFASDSVQKAGVAGKAVPKKMPEQN